MKPFLALSLAMLCVGCLQQDPHSPPTPPPTPVDGGLPPYDSDAEPVPDVPEKAACERMCKQMQKLGCPLGKPTPVRQEPCVSWCTRIQSKHELDLHPDCIARVSECTQIRSCNN